MSSSKEHGSRDALHSWRARSINEPHPAVITETQRALDRQCVDVLLLSAYLDHYPSVVALAAIARERGVPVLVGGPMFHIPAVTRSGSTYQVSPRSLARRLT